MTGAPWKPGECTARPAGSHPATVTIGETRTVEVNGQRRQIRTEETIPYDAWSGRCLKCFPAPGLKIGGTPTPMKLKGE